MTRLTAATRSLLLFLAALAATSAGAADDSALNLADLAAYRKALEPAAPTSAPAVAVSFDALWKNPRVYEGRRVRVEGRVVRRFRQKAFGTFPGLVEAWVATPSGNPFCLVYPTPDGNESVETSTIRFEGTFLRMVRYQGEDTARLAPLIVGPLAPRATVAPAQPAIDLTRSPWLDRIVALVVAVIVVAILVGQHLRKTASPAGDLDDGAQILFLDSAEGEPPGTADYRSHDDTDTFRDST